MVETPGWWAFCLVLDVGSLPKERRWPSEMSTGSVAPTKLAPDHEAAIDAGKNQLLDDYSSCPVRLSRAEAVPASHPAAEQIRQLFRLTIDYAARLNPAS
jgi:hypothetical protein